MHSCCSRPWYSTTTLPYTNARAMFFNDKCSAETVAYLAFHALENQFNDTESVGEFKARVFGDKLAEGQKVSEDSARSVLTLPQ